MCWQILMPNMQLSWEQIFVEEDTDSLLSRVRESMIKSVVVTRPPRRVRYEVQGPLSDAHLHLFLKSLPEHGFTPMPYVARSDEVGVTTYYIFGEGRHSYRFSLSRLNSSLGGFGNVVVEDHSQYPSILEKYASLLRSE